MPYICILRLYIVRRSFCPCLLYLSFYLSYVLPLMVNKYVSVSFCKEITPKTNIADIYYPQRRRTPVGGFTSVCLCVCLFFRTISQKKLGSPNLTYKCSTTSPGNAFVLGSNGLRSMSQKTVPMWVFALLWVPASSTLTLRRSTFMFFFLQALHAHSRQCRPGPCAGEPGARTWCTAELAVSAVNDVGGPASRRFSATWLVGYAGDDPPPTAAPSAVLEASTQQLSSDDEPTELRDDEVDAGTSPNVACPHRHNHGNSCIDDNDDDDNNNEWSKQFCKRPHRLPPQEEIWISSPYNT